MRGWLLRKGIVHNDLRRSKSNAFSILFRSAPRTVHRLTARLLAVVPQTARAFATPAVTEINANTLRARTATKVRATMVLDLVIVKRRGTVFIAITTATQLRRAVTENAEKMVRDVTVNLIGTARGARIYVTLRSVVTGTARRIPAVSAMLTGTELVVTSTAIVAFMVFATRITSASANLIITVLRAMCFVPARLVAATAPATRQQEPATANTIFMDPDARSFVICPLLATFTEHVIAMEPVSATADIPVLIAMYGHQILHLPHHLPLPRQNITLRHR